MFRLAFLKGNGIRSSWTMTGKAEYDKEERMLNYKKAGRHYEDE